MLVMGQAGLVITGKVGAPSTVELLAIIRE
jgi:hypothetical protein